MIYHDKYTLNTHEFTPNCLQRAVKYTGSFSRSACLLSLCVIVIRYVAAHTIDVEVVSSDAPHEVTAWLHMSLIQSGHCLRSFQRLFSVASASVIRSQWHLVLGRRASVCNVSFLLQASVCFHACILVVQNIYRALPPGARTCVEMFS